MVRRLRNQQGLFLADAVFSQGLVLTRSKGMIPVIHIHGWSNLKFPSPTETSKGLTWGLSGELDSEITLESEGSDIYQDCHISDLKVGYILAPLSNNLYLFGSAILSHICFPSYSTSWGKCV